MIYTLLTFSRVKLKYFQSGKVAVEFVVEKVQVQQVPFEYDGLPQLTRGQCQAQVGHSFAARINVNGDQMLLVAVANSMVMFD